MEFCHWVDLSSKEHKYRSERQQVVTNQKIAQCILRENARIVIRELDYLRAVVMNLRDNYARIYKILVEPPELKTFHRRSRYIWKVNIKMLRK
jgi:hypothetical protein